MLLKRAKGYNGQRPPSDACAQTLTITKQHRRKAGTCDSALYTVHLMQFHRLRPAAEHVCDLCVHSTWMGNLCNFPLLLRMIRLASALFRTIFAIKGISL